MKKATDSDSGESDEGDGYILCLDEAIENILVNEDFADADLTDMDDEDQGENEQSATVEEPSVLDQIRIDSVNEEIREA